MENVTNSLVAYVSCLYVEPSFSFTVDEEREQIISHYEKRLFSFRHLVVWLEVLNKYVAIGGTNYPVISEKFVQHLSNC